MEEKYFVCLQEGTPSLNEHFTNKCLHACPCLQRRSGRHPELVRLHPLATCVCVCMASPVQKEEQFLCLQVDALELYT
eukprot:scaffold24237_cov20-Tisochrysis_lutea.AAC.1